MGVLNVGVSALCLLTYPNAHQSHFRIFLTTRTKLTNQILRTKIFFPFITRNILLNRQFFGIVFRQIIADISFNFWFYLIPASLKYVFLFVFILNKFNSEFLV